MILVNSFQENWGENLQIFLVIKISKLLLSHPPTLHLYNPCEDCGSIIILSIYLPSLNISSHWLIREEQLPQIVKYSWLGVTEICSNPKILMYYRLTSALFGSFCCWSGLSCVEVTVSCKDHVYRIEIVEVQQYLTKPNHCIWPIRTHYTFVSTNEQFAPNEDDLAMVQWPSTITILYIWSLSETLSSALSLSIY